MTEKQILRIAVLGTSEYHAYIVARQLLHRDSNSIPQAQWNSECLTLSLCLCPAISEFAYSLLQFPTVKKRAVKEKSYEKSPDHPEMIKPDSYNILLKS